jgi:hypothetical protein
MSPPRVGQKNSSKSLAQANHWRSPLTDYPATAYEESLIDITERKKGRGNISHGPAGIAPRLRENIFFPLP